MARLDRWIEQGSFLRPKGLDDDLQRVRQAMIRPGPFLAVVHGDACPDNNRIYGDTAVLLDFQVVAIDHCLLDGAHFTVPFPTCWCVGQLDGSVGQAATDAYRQELAAGLPQVNDDEFWMSSLAEATACWFLLRGIPGLRPALAADELWGTATMAQRLIQRSSRFAILSRQASVLPALADLAEQLSEAVRGRWPALGPTPAYPAFARPGQAVAATPAWWNPAP